jgi:glucosylceramidase
VATAVANPDRSIALVIFNPTEDSKTIEIQINNNKKIISISAKALQTVVIKPE